MSAPNMATITASLERSLQNCSLNQSSISGSGGGFGSSSTSDSPENHHFSNSSDTALELNSQISLPYHWEQCLDLKTGEVYYINWRTGMKAKDDPRTTAEYSGDFYSENDSSYDSEGSSSESSPLSSSGEQYHHHQQHSHHQTVENQRDDQVLVVAGCKSCLMYFMVPKQVEDCPKCNGHLLHFDRSGNGSP
ncbi:protein CURLY FLAG LEAF 1 [Cornus florida]|uniref:protein CURLY FLAG LEAF 1 n=1 Tax=Cornus florida TaxID=4283 RepID=UPI00289861F8|nr:protein CURLY FLAG LEAF 1 [Cornus florida]